MITLSQILLSGFYFTNLGAINEVFDNYCLINYEAFEQQSEMAFMLSEDTQILVQDNQPLVVVETSPDTFSAMFGDPDEDQYSVTLSRVPVLVANMPRYWQSEAGAFSDHVKITPESTLRTEHTCGLNLPEKVSYCHLTTKGMGDHSKVHFNVWHDRQEHESLYYVADLSRSVNVIASTETIKSEYEHADERGYLYRYTITITRILGNPQIVEPVRLRLN